MKLLVYLILMLMTWAQDSNTNCTSIPNNTLLNLSSIPTTDTVPFKRLYHTMDYNYETKKLIIFGGRRDLNLQYNDIWGFDVENQTYSIYYATNEFAPAARSHSGSFADSANNLFYIFGGLTEKGPQNDLWSFDLNSYRWRRMYPQGQTPTSRYRFGYTKFNWNGTLIFAVYGGSLSEGESDELYFYNTTSNSWTKISPATPIDLPKLNGPHLKFYKGCLYLATGDATSNKDGAKEFKGLFKYSLENNTWEEIKTSNEYEYRYYTQTALIGSYLYLLYGWSDSESYDVETLSYIDLDDPGIWIHFEVAGLEPFDSYSSAVVDDKIYIFGGYVALTAEYLNRMIFLEGKESDWSFTLINKNYEIPLARQYHSMSAINGELYIYGGLGLTSILGDMWKLNKEKEWEAVDVLGAAPSYRYGHASASSGDMIAIWGGNSESGLLNDLYLFSAFSNYWKKIEPTGLLPSAKIGCCLIMDLPSIYIFGGRSNAGLSNELWHYDSSNNSYTQIKAEDPPPARYYASCELLDNSIWVMLGTGASESPLRSIFTFNMISWVWSEITPEGYPPESRSLGVVKHFNNSILSLGGQAWTTDPMDTIYLIDPNSGCFSCVGKMPIYFYAGAFTLIETTLYLYGGGSLIGDSLRLSVPSLSFNYLDLKQLKEFNKMCSPGSYYNSSDGKCITCKAGFYSSGYYNNNCTACPRGTYNSNDGATSENQCYPCSYGTYSNVTNATYCLQCPVGKVCPIGSTTYYEDEVVSTLNSIQPENYSIDQSTINIKITIVLASILGCLAICFIIFLLLPFVQDLVKEIDLFYEEHNYELLVKMYIKKNTIGGCFFFMFCLIALIIIGLSWIDYIDDNIIEEKTLRPMAVLDEMVDHISGTFNIKVEFLNYGGKCKSATGGLNPEFKIDFQSGSVELGQVSYSNKPEGSSCIIELTCSKCELDVSDMISFSLNEEESYCSGISVTLSSESSIPSSSSTMQSYLSSTSYKVFRGYEATVFYFKMTPSYFKSYISEYGDYTGYHVSVDVNPKSGSEHLISEIPFSSGLNLLVSLDVNKDGLYTERSYKQTVAIVLATLLGSVFGIMGAFVFAMRTFEGIFNGISKNIEKKNDDNRLIKNREKYGEMLKHQNHENEEEEKSIIEEKDSNSSLITPRI